MSEHVRSSGAPRDFSKRQERQLVVFFYESLQKEGPLSLESPLGQAAPS